MSNFFDVNFECWESRVLFDFFLIKINTHANHHSYVRLNMSEVVVLGPRSAAFGAKSLSPLLF